MGLRNKVQLIAYPNRMGNGLKELHQIMHEYLANAIGGVHILPIYPSNADGGFSPLTHKEVDPAYGTWKEVEDIAKQFDLCLDLTLNHISDESVEFKDYLAKGKRSKHADLFVDVDALGEITDADLAKIHIRKEKSPFREITFGDGTKGRVWCTFTEHQVDLNFRSPHTLALLEDYMQYMMDRGVKLFRLDAFGYVTKRIGTSCFLIEPETYNILSMFNHIAQSRGAAILPEVHDHFSYQQAIASRDMYAYGFALPVLVLHAFLQKNTYYLKNWLRICPTNQITVLDTHDGICFPDVEELLPKTEVDKVIADVSDRSGDPVLRGSAAHVGSVGAIYQLTCTYLDALYRNPKAYLAARAIQFFCPGIPQVYYQGLLFGENDHELYEKTGEKRDINRTFYSKADAEEMLQKAGPRRLISLMQFRSFYPAFEGRFNLHYSEKDSLWLSWTKGEFRTNLRVNLTTLECKVTYVDLASLEECELDLSLPEEGRFSWPPASRPTL